MQSVQKFTILMHGIICNNYTFFLVSITLLCSCTPEAKMVLGVAGSAGNQTAVFKGDQGNPFGYYEYLPKDFDSSKNLKPLIFYWNGANTITGHGDSQEIIRLLDQGLPMNINNGKNYNAIIISAQLQGWKKVDVYPFVKYILKRYEAVIDSDKIYMTGFSAGGGITARFANDYPDVLAAIVLVAPALHMPKRGRPSKKMAAIPSWIFHNEGDSVVDPVTSIAWHKTLKKIGGDHRLTVYPVNSHYAWQEVYEDKKMWEWLYSKKKSQRDN